MKYLHCETTAWIPACNSADLAHQDAISIGCCKPCLLYPTIDDMWACYGMFQRKQLMPILPVGNHCGLWVWSHGGLFITWVWIPPIKFDINFICELRGSAKSK